MFVVLLLLKIKYLSPDKVFMICTGAHAISFLCYTHFFLATKSAPAGQLDHHFSSSLSLMILLSLLPPSIATLPAYSH
jgi:hypothetical protein